MNDFVPVKASDWIEDILHRYPASQDFFAQNGIVCLRCGEPVWGSLTEQMDEKNMDAAQQENLLNKLNAFLQNQQQ